MTDKELATQYHYTIEQSRTRTLCWNVVNDGDRHHKNYRSEDEAWAAAVRHGRLGSTWGRNK